MVFKGTKLGTIIKGVSINKERIKHRALGCYKVKKSEEGASKGVEKGWSIK